MSMLVVVVGAGATGSELARRLSALHEVVLIDPDAQALERFGEAHADGEHKGGETEPQLVQGDGTSRLQLSKHFQEDRSCALVAAGGSDEVNLETARFARELGFDPVLALQHEAESADAFHAENVTCLDRAQLLADHVERSIQHKGAIVPTGIGLGRGELLEVRLVSTSPVIDRPLKDMGPDRWRFAAVFRGDELIVPTGETRLAVDDRVLLVGDPRVLGSISEYIRLGTPQFPGPYGTRVVSIERNGVDEKLCREARGLAEACKTDWARGRPGDGKTTKAGKDAPESASCADDEGTFGFGDFHDDGIVDRIDARHPGVVVIPPWEKSFLQRVMGRRGPDGWFCDNVDVPVLFGRGSFPYRRILLPVSESRLSVEAAEMAIDITRRLDASLTAVNVDLPKYISGASEEMIHFEVVPVRKLCQLYEVPLEYRHHVGNPIRLLLQEAKQHDLLVMARYPGRADSFFNPDVALHIARRAACSVIVLTVRAPEA